VVRGIYKKPGAAYKTQNARVLAEFRDRAGRFGPCRSEPGRPESILRAECAARGKVSLRPVPDDKDQLPNDGVYRAILWALALTVMAGAVFAIVGATVLHDPVMTRVGTGVALVGGAIYAFFRRLGARQAGTGGAGTGDAGRCGGADDHVESNE